MKENKNMKATRQGVFETNSSSTHSICIAKSPKINLPNSIHFAFGEFGWEVDRLGTMGEKASYLFTGLFNNKRDEDFYKIVKLLESKGIDVSFEEKVSETHTYKGRDGKIGSYETDNCGHVDHSDELGDFLDAVCSDEDKLMSYLFSGLSFILTGNDNDDLDVDIKVNYPHDEYYKGN